MKIDFKHGGKNYLGFDTDSEEWENLNIPDADKQQIITDAQWDVIRKQREPLLDEADKLISKALDNSADASSFRAYRQELRDITTTFSGRLDEVLWPDKPQINS